MEGITKYPPSDIKILEKINEIIDEINNLRVNFEIHKKRYTPEQ